MSPTGGRLASRCAALANRFLRVAAGRIAFPEQLRVAPCNPILAVVATTLWALHASIPLAAQTDASRLEARLATASGRERLELLVALATAHREESSARAVELGEEALELLRTHPDRKRQLEVLNALAYAQIVLGAYEPALQLSAQARKLAREAGDKVALALAFQNAGRAHRSSSAFENAIEAYRQAGELYAEIGDQPGLGDSLNEAGIVHWMRGDYPKALDYFIQARQKYETEGDLRRIASILNNTGMIYRRLQQPAKALALYEEALEIRRTVGSTGAISNVLNNIGNIHRDRGEASKALELYLESLDVGPRDQNGHANTLINVGAAYQELDAPDRAMRYFKEALAAKEALGDRHGVAGALFRIGSLQREKGELGSALATLRRSLEIYQEIETRDETKTVLLELSAIYSDTGRFREAYESFKEYERIKSEIYNEHNSKMIAEIETRIDLDRKQLEIESLKQQQVQDALELELNAATRRALLGGGVLLALVAGLLYNRYRLKAQAKEEQRHRRERERYIAEIEARNAEMERFAYTVSHDLKSPLVTIRGFLGLVEQDAVRGREDQLKQDLARVDAAAQRMALLLDELLDLSKIGRVVHEPEELSPNELVGQVLEQLALPIADRGAEVEIAPDLPPVVGDRIRLMEVFQNLIENALKFSGDQPRVRIGWRRDGEESVIFVHDNGAGIDPSYQHRIFRLFERLDPEIDGTGIGLALVKRIIEVHRGRIWVESEGVGRGSTFCFTIGTGAEARTADSGETTATEASI